ncbi:MAG: hypothetical protein NWF13_00745 [Candidatus Bathyarchaeota archaeon]|nr:hypothetical protein [Candidatus Bathyarchaeota archaeon]
MISKNIVKWLVEPEHPSVRYRTLVELLGNSPTDSEVKECKNQIAESTPVKILLDKMHPDGYWLQKNPRTGEIIGKGVEYGAYGTTHYCLSYLAELGMDRSHPQIAKAAERYLSLQKNGGDFYRHFSCLLGYNIRTFTMLGYRDDPRVKRSINILLNTERLDGGYLCDMHEGKYKTKSVKSCIRGSVKALLAFSHLPEYWKHGRIKKLVPYFLSRDGIFKSTNLKKLVNKDMERVSFPITWRANVFEVLLALGKMGYGKDSRLERAWNVLEVNRDDEGRYLLDWTPSQSPWKVGKRNEPNKWVTFYAYLARTLYNLEHKA